MPTEGPHSRPILRLRRGRDKLIDNRHPWVFSGAVEPLAADVEPGEVADLVGPSGLFVSRGYVNPRSKLLFRVLTSIDEAIDGDFLQRRLAAAAGLRAPLFTATTDAYRVVNGEGDRVPGLTVDRYGDFLVCQLTTAGVERLRGPILDALQVTFKPRGIWERSEGRARREEGLRDSCGLVRGVEPPDRISIQEDGVRFAVDVRGGQKTGFFLDQRPARALVRSLASGRRVLDLCAYTGGFSVSAVVGGAAAVVAIDASAPSLALVGEHLTLNGLADTAVERVTEDAFQALRRTRESYDIVVVDPPPFAKRKAEVQGACRGYKELNMQAMKCLAPGGFLVTSSCSHHIDWKLFQQVLFAAAKDAAVELQILSRIGHPADHPVSIYHPEGEYLKTFVLHKPD